MAFFDATEFQVITIGIDRTLRAVRFTRRKTAVVGQRTAIAPDARTLAERLAELAEKTGLRRGHILIIGAAVPGAVFFRHRMPLMPKRELAAAMELEVPQHLLKHADDPAFQFVAVPAGEQADLSVWVASRALLNELFTAMTELKLKADAVVSPYLAIPADLPADEAVWFREFDPDFYWCGQSFHPVGETPPACNGAIRKYLQSRCTFRPEMDDREMDDYLPALLLGLMAMHKDFGGKFQHLDLLPKGLRPQRLRFQLHLMLCLLALFLILTAVGSFGQVSDYYREVRTITDDITTLKKQTAAGQKRLSTRNKEFKEMQKVLEQHGESPRLLHTLGLLSEALPKDMLVNPLQLTETTISMTMYTNQQNPDLSETLRRLKDYKVATLMNQNASDTLTVVTLRLNKAEKTK